jgi:hypothetical protein
MKIDIEPGDDVNYAAVDRIFTNMPVTQRDLRNSGASIGGAWNGIQRMLEAWQLAKSKAIYMKKTEK